jgi:hypothetical protein
MVWPVSAGSADRASAGHAYKVWPPYDHYELAAAAGVDKTDDTRNTLVISSSGTWSSQVNGVEMAGVYDAHDGTGTGYHVQVGYFVAVAASCAEATKFSYDHCACDPRCSWPALLDPCRGGPRDRRGGPGFGVRTICGGERGQPCFDDQGLGRQRTGVGRRRASNERQFRQGETSPLLSVNV